MAAAPCRLAAAALAVALLAASTAAAVTTSEDAFVAGYAAAVLERELKLAAPSLRVENGVIYLDARDLAGADRARAVKALEAVRGAARVEIVEAAAEPPVSPVAPEPPPAAPEPPPLRILSEWQAGLLPGGSLFKPLLADPRWPHFAASYQRLFEPERRDTAAVSFGETFALFRDRLGGGWWEVGIQAGVFAIFDLDTDSKDLVNADYLVGIPLSFRQDDFSVFLRLFHQSSHLGDEFLLRTKADRLNLSYEAVDLKLSYEIGDVARLYGGAGILFDQDPEGLDPWSLQYGVEFTSPWPSRDVGWRPVGGVDVQHREENDWSSDLSVRAGVQIDGVLLTRNMQLLFEYFNGRSPHGQFFRTKIEYLGLGVHFHF